MGGAGDVCEEGGCKCTCEEGWEAPLVLEDQFRNSDGFFDTLNGYREGACICDKSLTCAVDALTGQECGPWGTCTCATFASANAAGAKTIKVSVQFVTPSLVKASSALPMSE